jgi:acetyl/propionyl-CoA carboxylase alpha subunit
VKEVRYRSAGTIEFLVDDHGAFYFLEMNTRLQVEHPVTEEVTGVDLVRAQILQALNPGDTVLRESPVARGCAIEVRLYAEDPTQGFAPTPGTVTRLRWPTGTGIRVESGIEEGQTVGTSFDSMLAKLIVKAETREQAISRMRFALDETVIHGLGTNQLYLRALCDDEAVFSGKVHTGYLGQAYSDFAPVPAERDLQLLSEARAAGLTRGASLNTGNAQREGNWPSPWEVFTK